MSLAHFHCCTKAYITREHEGHEEQQCLAPISVTYLVVARLAPPPTAGL